MIRKLRSHLIYDYSCFYFHDELNQLEAKLCTCVCSADADTLLATQNVGSFAVATLGHVEWSHEISRLTVYI